MEFNDLVRERKSIHSFKNEEVSKETIEGIVDKARFAPSAWNLQPWKVIVLSSEEDMEKASEAAEGQEFVTDADKIAVICGDLRFDTNSEKALQDAVEKNYLPEDEIDLFKEIISGYKDKDFSWKREELIANCAFFTSNVIQAAWDENVGTCPMNIPESQVLKDYLNLEQYLPLFLVPIGYPDEEREKKWRRDTDDILEFR